MKKIIIVDNSPSFTGAFKCALQEAELLKHEYDFCFVLPRFSEVKKKVEERGFRCYSLPFREIRRSLLNNLFYIPSLLNNGLALKRILKKEKAACLQLNDFYNLTGYVAKWMGFQGLLITYVRLLPSSRISLLSRLWSYLAARFSDKVVCVSDAVLKQMPGKKNISRLYDPINFEEKYFPPPERKAEVSLLFLANYIRGKGQEQAVMAFAEAYKKNPKLRLRFAGGIMNLKKNNDFKQSLIVAINRMGMEDVVRFEDFADDTERIIKESDIVLNFSEAESFSMTCAEAGFYGKPVISTRCGGPEEIIADQFSGLLVDKGNIAQMTNAILELAGNEEKRNRYGEYARDYIRQKFSTRDFVTGFKAIIEGAE